MDLADPAGTLQSGMSPTLGTENDEENVKFGLCFLVNYDEDGVYIASCLNVSPVIGKSLVGVMAAEKLTGIQNREIRSLSAAIAAMYLRARYTNTESPGPYLVKTSSPLSRDDLEKYLRSLDNTALKSFLQRSKI